MSGLAEDLRPAMVLVALLLAGHPNPARASELRQGLALLDAWQLEQAHTLAEEVLAATPENVEAWLLAGRVQHARGEHLSAYFLLRAAAEAGSREAAALLPRVEGSALYAPHFAHLDTRHFSVRYLNKDEVMAHYATEVLEAAYTRIGSALEILPAERGQKIVVEIYPDARALAAATGLTLDEIETSGTIAVCKFHRLMLTSPLSVSNGYGWADTLAHEFVHLLVAKKSKNNVPIWLHEGIAKFYESIWKADAGQALSPHAEHLLAQAQRTGDFISYADMHPSMAKLPSQEAAALAFAEVFTTIEFVFKRHGPRAVPRLLESLGAGVPLERALREILGTDLLGLEKQWKRYLGKRPSRHSVPGTPRRISLATPEGDRPSERPLEGIEDAEVRKFARLGELLHLGGHYAAAVLEYEKAVERAGHRYPTLSYRLARAYQQQRRPDEALKVLERTLELDADDGDSHLLAGRIHLAREDVEQARRHFEAARYQNPYNPQLHVALLAIYEAQGNSAAAEREKRFAQLCSTKRPELTVALPAPSAGSATVSLLTVPWARVRFDAEKPIATPVWHRRLPPGEHAVEILFEDGSSETRRFQAISGEARVVVFELKP